MNVKNNIKKVFAVAASAALVGTTMVGAFAYDLGDYPAPFVKDGVFNGAVVVGANAATADVLGAIDIAASLQAEAKVGSAISGTAVAVEGGEVIDTYDLNQELSATTLTESDIDSLLDTKFRWNSQDVEVKEEIVIAADAIGVHTYRPTTGGQDEDFGSDPYLVIDTAEKIEYRYVFESAIDVSELADHPLEIKFLGKTLSISDIADGSMTIEASNDFYMEEGDVVDVEGHKITLKRVGTNAVLVSVDGQTLTISNTDTNPVSFTQANDFEVQLESMFYIEGADDNSATLKMGTSIEDTVVNDDPMEMFGESDDEDEAEWVWKIEMAGVDIADGDYIAAVQQMVRTKVNIEGADERPALAMGESLDFPNNYANIEFIGFEDSKQTQYEDLKIKPVNTKLNGVYTQAMEISTTASKDSLYVSDDGTLTKTSKVYVDLNGNIYDSDKETPVITSAALNVSEDSVFLQLDKETVDITFDAARTLWTVSAESVDTFDLIVNANYEHFGANKGSAEDTEVEFNNVDFGENDDTFRTTYGIIVDDMESQMDRDEFKISVPLEQQIPVIVVKSKGTVVSSAATGMAYNVNPIALGLGVLDTDAPALGSKPMIVVGGPVVNTVAAALMGNPTPEQISATFAPGKALIKFYSDSNAMLVAGYEAEETLGAAYAVAKYDKYDFEGNELEVVVTSLNNIKVNSVN